MSTPNKPTPFSVITDHLADKTPVAMIHATLSGLYDRKQSAEGAEKPWALQNGELTEIGTGAKIPVVFKDRDEVPKSWKGRAVFLESKHGEKGISGVYVFDDDYKPKAGTSFTRKIKVTATGQVSLVEGGGQQQQPQTHHQAATPPAGGGYRKPAETQGQQSQQKQATTPSGDGVKDFRRKLAQCVTGWSLCYDAAAATAWGIYERHGQLTPGGAVGIMADKFFIEMARTGMLWGLPVGKVVDILGHPPRKISDLTKLLGEAAVVAEVNKAAAVAAVTQPAAKPQPQQHRQADPEPEPEQPPPGGWQDGMEEDDIPF